jgi:cellulose synthase operon protein C
MRIDCEQCGAAFSIDDALITDRGVRAQCPKCGHQKVVKKQAVNPFAPPSSPTPVAMGGPPIGVPPPMAPPAMGANPFAPSASANPFAAAPAAAPANPFAASPLPRSPTPGPGNPFAAPFATPSTNPPTGPNPSPFASSTIPSGNPFPTQMNSAVGGAPTTAPDPMNRPVSGSGSPFGSADGFVGTATPAPFPQPAGFAPPAPFPTPVNDPFSASSSPSAGSPAAPFSPAPSSSPSSPTAQPMLDPFAALTGGGTAEPDPFAQLADHRGADAGGSDGGPGGAPPAPPADDDPFAKLDLNRAARGERPGAAPDMDGPRPGSSKPPTPAAAGKQAKPAGARAKSPPNIGRIAAILAAVAGLAVVVGGVVVLGPELFEKTTDAGVNPLRRAKPAWEKQFPSVTGTAQEHIDAGRTQMKLDTAAGYRKADEELRQALLIEVGNVSAIASWVENFTHLPAVRADVEAVQLAQEAIEYAAKKEPDNVDVVRAQGLLRLAMNDTDGAQRELARAQRLAPDSADTLLAHARSHVDRNPQDALALVQQVRARDSTLKSAVVVEGAAQRRLGGYKEAREALGARLAEDPTNTGALKEMAKLELDVGNPEQAIEALTRLLAAEERDVDAHLMRAKIAYQALPTANGLQRADGYLDVVLKQHESAAGELLLPTLAHAAYVKAELGNLDEAQKLAERARATDGSYPPALFVLGRIYALQKSYDEAKKALEQAVRTSMARDQFYEPVTRTELARVQALSGDIPSALRNYDQAIEYDPRYLRAHFGLASTYIAEKPLSPERATQAMTVMRRAWENDPHWDSDRLVLSDYPTPRRDLIAFADAFANAKVTDTGDDESLIAQKHAAEAMIRYQAGQRAEAENLTRKSLAADRANLFALLYLGVIEYNAGRFPDARKRLRLAIDTTGTPHAVTRLYLARAEMKTGDVEAARKRLQDLVDQEPNFVQAAFSRAMLMRQEGLTAQANDELRKIVRADADYTPAKRALSEAR